MKDQTEVCPLSRGVMFLEEGNPYPVDYQTGIRLLRPPLPAALSASLAARFPWREHDGLTKFRLSNRMG